MQESAARDGFIICMRENDEYMFKLPRVPQRNRKIRDQKKTNYPKQENAEEND